MTELERLLSQDDACLISVASVKRALKQDSKKVKPTQYMKYIAIGGVALEVNKEIDKGAKVILMVPFLQTDNWGPHTVGYNVLFEKEEERNEQKSETITEFADRCRECESKYGKLLKKLEDKIKEVCFSPEKEWREFRASYGTRGQIDYIINYIKSLQSSECMQSEE